MLRAVASNLLRKKTPPPSSKIEFNFRGSFAFLCSTGSVPQGETGGKKCQYRFRFLVSDACNLLPVKLTDRLLGDRAWGPA